MKLFVWVDPYQFSYGSSMVFAVAETLEDAKEIVKGDKSNICTFGSVWKQGGMDIELGEPDRISELPCAEWHEWSE